MLRTLMSLAVVLVAVLFSAPSRAGFDEGFGAFGRGDYATALKEFRPLAEQGHTEAQKILGQMYKDGTGVSQDYEEAVRWYRLAEEGGHRLQYMLGELYLYGRGVPQDYAEAMKRFRFFAEQGLGPAQVDLGFMYANGWGVPQDYVLAHMWFNLAAAQDGDPLPTEMRDTVAKRMTTAQIAEAQRLAREWKSKNLSPK